MSGLTIGGFVAANPGARLLRAGGDTSLSPFRPSTDTRSIRPGDAFVCLRGPNFNGNDFIGQAAERGASVVVADESDKIPQGIRIPSILVDDAKRAYLRGASAARRLAKCTVIGVTGSVGKTTTTSMCSQLLERSTRVIKTPQNDNNEIGVSRLCYELADGVDVAVIEMGARGPGQIAELVDVARPDIGILTGVGNSHMEFFSDRESLARTKFAMFGAGAKAVLSAADEWSRRLAGEQGLASDALWVRTCGDPHVDGLTLEAGTPDEGRVALTFGASHAFAAWHIAGEHHLRDALLAAGAAILAGLPFEKAAAGLGALTLPPGRFEIHRLAGGAMVVYDAYNASPASMEHALRAFSSLPASRRIAVLGSMAELGADALALHEATGAAAAASRVDSLYCGGAMAEALARGARDAGMADAKIHIFEDNESVARALRDSVGHGDAVLLKGSRVQRMEEILAALTAAGAPAS